MIIQCNLEGKEVGRYYTLAEAGRISEADPSTIRKVINGDRATTGGYVRKEEEVEDREVSEGTWEAFLREQGINPDDVKSRKTWQSGENTRYSVALKEDIEDEKEKFKEGLLKSMEKYSAKVHKKKYGDQNRNACVINLFDAHIDKLCLVSETNEDSDFKDNLSRFEKAFDELLTTAVSFKPELIIIPVGNDFYHTNGPLNTTVKGTPLEVMVKSEEAFVKGLETYRNCIDKASQYSKVYCPVIKGNHDADKDFYLGECLKVAYERNENVEIENSRHQRKYISYGENMFGFAHGDKEVRKIDQLPLIMAEEQKQMWADTKYREWFLGDKHHKFEYKFLKLKDFVGCTVRFLRSVGTTDKWHHDNAYVGIPRTAELFVFDKKNGPKANFMVHIN